MSKSLSFKMLVHKGNFFATFIKYKCNFFNFLVQQKLALVMRLSFKTCFDLMQLLQFG